MRSHARVRLTASQRQVVDKHKTGSPTVTVKREKLERCELCIQAMIERLDGVGEKKVHLSS